MEFDNGVSAVEVTEDMQADIGYSYADGAFTAPPPTEADREAQQEAAKAANVATKDSLMSEVSLRISVLQDAADLDMSSDAEATALPLWKKYPVLLSRVEAVTAIEITWPLKPE